MLKVRLGSAVLPLWVLSCSSAGTPVGSSGGAPALPGAGSGGVISAGTGGASSNGGGAVSNGGSAGASSGGNTSSGGSLSGGIGAQSGSSASGGGPMAGNAGATPNGGTSSGGVGAGGSSAGSAQGGRAATAGNAGSGPAAGAPASGALCGGKADGARMERLKRGVVAVRSGNGNYVGFRLLGFESSATGFNVYRDGTKVTPTPITNSTNYLDAGAPANAKYSVRAVVDGVEQAASEEAETWPQNYLEIPLQPPAGGMTSDGEYTYVANDASAADLDGDGTYEFILKWDPTNAKDNSQPGYTGNVFIDAYKQTASGFTRLWRIDLGRNVRAGAHYTQFMVYDFDGDGKAEMALRASDGAVDGRGTLIGSASADHRNSSGYVLAGPEWLCLFEGETGKLITRTDYVPARGQVNSWGDDYGNRVDRFLAGVAYLDGKTPSLIMARGYYTRTVITAWDYSAGMLKQRWVFDSKTNNDPWSGQGDHSLSIADVDGDGRQEIVYGAMTVDDTGKGLYNTGLGHGDALHVGDFVPSRPGLEVFNVQERVDAEGAHLRDAKNGQVLWAKPTSGEEGPGRGVGADIFAGNPGAEFWAAGGGISGLFSATGQNIGRQPSSTNFLVYWDADPLRELLDRNRIDKYGTSSDTRLLTATDCVENNGTKATPSLSADLFGDWREEVIWRKADNRALRIYTTTAVTDRRIFTLMHDPQYRVAVAWQNTAYNQPPHPSFFIGDGMTAPPEPNIIVPCP